MRFSSRSVGRPTTYGERWAKHGKVLDILVTSRQDARAAARFFRKLLTGLEYVPRVVVTDKLASYGAARRRVLRSVEHRRSRYLNNRAKNSHQPLSGSKNVP
jgi:putative transposase